MQAFCNTCSDFHMEKTGNEGTNSKRKIRVMKTCYPCGTKFHGLNNICRRNQMMPFSDHSHSIHFCIYFLTSIMTFSGIPFSYGLFFWCFFFSRLPKNGWRFLHHQILMYYPTWHFIFSLFFWFVDISAIWKVWFYFL